MLKIFLLLLYIEMDPQHLLELYYKYKEIYEKTGKNKINMIRSLRHLKKYNISIPIQKKISSPENISNNTIQKNYCNDKIENSVLIIKNINSNIEYLSIFQKELKGIIKESYDSNYDKIIWMNTFQKIEKKEKNQTFFYVIETDINQWTKEEKNIIQYNHNFIDYYIFFHKKKSDELKKIISSPFKSIFIENIKEKNIHYFSSINKLKLYCIPIRYANIFYHFFYIGGGETFLNDLLEKNQKETINYVSSKHKYKTYSPLINRNIILYDNVQELNKYLYHHQIIIDHQLYWGGLSGYEMIYKNHQIINLIHGAEIINNKSIVQNFISFIPNKNKYISNHICFHKLLNFNKNIQFKKNSIKGKPTIGIIGNINCYKFPIESISMLNELSSIFRIYIIGDVNNGDKKYLEYIKQQVKKSDIQFIGYLEKNKLYEFLKEHINIVLSLSKNEMGSYSIIDAQRFGIPVICRNTDTLRYLNSSEKHLYNSYKDILPIAKSIKNNLDYYSKESCRFILNETNSTVDLTFIEFIEYLSSCKEKNIIPNIVHFIFGLKIQTEEFSYVYYLSILSYLFYNKPKYVFFYYTFEPYGLYWDMIKHKLILIKIPKNFEFKIGNKIAEKFAHKADFLRIELLKKYGGVYVDMDTITNKNFTNLFHYDFIIGFQEKYNNIDCLCNAIMFGKPNNTFINEWYNRYPSYFEKDKWCEASVHLPGIIYQEKKFNHNILIVNEDMMLRPLYTETHKIFENSHKVHQDLICLHLWESFSSKYFNSIHEDYIYKSDTMYATILKTMKNEMNLIRYPLEEYKLFPVPSFSYSLKKIYSISIIIPYYYTPFPIFKKAILSILNQRNIFFLNIEVILIDDGTRECYTYIKNIPEIKESSWGFQFKIIELNQNIGVSDAISIGIQHSSHDLIVRFDTDDIMHPDRIGYQVFQYEQEKNKNIILFSHFRGFSNSLEPKDYQPRPGISTYQDIIKDIHDQCHMWYVCHPSVFFHKKLVKSIYPRNCKGLCEDLILWIYNSCHQIKIISKPSILHLYRDNDNNTSKKNRTQFKNWKNNFKSILKIKSKEEVKQYLEKEYFSKEFNHLEYIQEIYKI